ncbi:MAG TPA: RNA methyltransferase [Terriglobales bacterium]|nr:RNA methyltransferase [Terriglobales bacterium]
MKTAKPAERLRRVEGRHNSLVKELRQAFSRGELAPSGECAIEGFRVIEEAVRSGLRIRTIFFAESAEPRAHKLLPQIAAQAEALLLPDKLFASAVSSQTPQGVAALVSVKSFAADEVIGSSWLGPLLVIAGVQDPGNLGTIIRSAEAFGAKGILLGEGTVSAYNSKVVRASTGSVFRVPIAKTSMEKAIERLRGNSFRLLATSSHKGTQLREAALHGATAVFIGNEGAGIDKKLLAQMDELIMIPHSAKVESLNAGIAASIVLYEAARQKT